MAALAIGFGAVTAVLWEFMEYYTFIRHSNELRTAYTDTLGDLPYNQRLSLDRAAIIRTSLTRDGLDPNAISIAGRGKLDLLVPTGDQVPEPQNRRVEITVR